MYELRNDVNSIDRIVALLETHASKVRILV
jgi:hypothetical protein